MLIETAEQCLYVCECKFRNEPVDSVVIAEVERKISKLSVPRGWSVKKVLIAPRGATSAVVESEYFDKIMTTEDFFGSP